MTVHAHGERPSPTGSAVLTSNGLPVPADLTARMHEVTPAPGDVSALRERYTADGYVLVRGLLDPERVRELRADYFARFDPRTLAPGTRPVDGVASGWIAPSLPPYGTAGHPAYALVRSAPFDALTREPALRAVAEALLGGPAELVRRRIVRHFSRYEARASRAHVDHDYMDRGDPRVVTAWIPIGDCPVACGGLVYLSGSHRVPRSRLDQLRDHTDRPDDRRPISNDLALTARTLGGRWLFTDYAAGDVVLHSPHLVHASLDDHSDVMRLSVDVRFRPVGAPRDERWDADWSADDGF